MLFIAKKPVQKINFPLIISISCLLLVLGLSHNNIIDISPVGRYNKDKEVLAQEETATCDEKIATGEAISKAEELATGTITKVNTLLYYISEEERMVKELLDRADQCSAGNCETGCGSTGTRTCNPHLCDPSNVTTSCTGGYLCCPPNCVSADGTSCTYPDESADDACQRPYQVTGGQIIDNSGPPNYWSIQNCESLENNLFCLDYCNATYCKSNPGNCTCSGKTCQEWRDTIFAPFQWQKTPTYGGWCHIQWPTCYDACPACEPISCDLSSTTACPVTEINAKFEEINNLYAGTSGIENVNTEIQNLIINPGGIFPIDPDRQDEDIAFMIPRPTNLRDYIKLKLDVAGSKLQQCIATTEEFETGGLGKLLFKCPLALEWRMLAEGYPEENCYYYPNNYVCCKY